MGDRLRTAAALPRGAVAAAPARVWARVDDGTWRARVTLAFAGTTEDEQDDAEQRRASDQLAADRAAAFAQKTAERDARDAAKIARREAGTVRGEYWPTWKQSIAELKRQQRLEEAKAFLEECREAARREATLSGDVPDPWPSEQLAAVIRRLGDRAGELATLEDYVAHCTGRDIPDSIVAKLAKARIANAAST